MNTDPVQARQAEERAAVEAEHVLQRHEIHASGWHVGTCACSQRWAEREPEFLDAAHAAHIDERVEDGPTAEDGMTDEAYADLVRRRGW